MEKVWVGTLWKDKDKKKSLPSHKGHSKTKKEFLSFCNSKSTSGSSAVRGDGSPNSKEAADLPSPKQDQT